MQEVRRVDDVKGARRHVEPLHRCGGGLDLDAVRARRLTRESHIRGLMSVAVTSAPRNAK
jgi:hypothetical protein